MKAFKESDILSQTFRVAVIEEITKGWEAKARKAEHEKREEVFKDRTREYALRLIKAEMGEKAVLELQHRTPNISMTKKVVEKKARVYKDEPVRKAEKETDQKALDGLAKYLKLNAMGKTINKKVELHQNVQQRAMPVENYSEKTLTGAPTWGVKLSMVQPARYDVIEDPDDPTQPLVTVLSYIDLGDGLLSDYRSADNVATKIGSGEQATTRAAAAMDPKKQRFIFWSQNYHMTTDGAGDIVAEGSITPKGAINPWGVNPYTPYSKNQGESYWADGGEGLADNPILFNLLLGDLNYSAKYQGTGLGYIICKNPPSDVVIGANRFVRINMEEGDPEPKIGFASANPELVEAMQVIEQQLAFWLTTEGLEPGAIAGKLDASNLSSGIHAVIEKSEPVSAIEEEQQLYQTAEPIVVDKVCKMVARLRALNLPLCKELAELNLPEELPYTLTFSSAKPMLTEEQRVDVVSKKQKLGLYLDEDLVKELHPDWEEKVVNEYMAKLQAQKKEKAALEPKPAPDPNAPPKPAPQA